VRVPEGRFVIEQAPIRDNNGKERGVVAEGAVGSRWAGRFRSFRYEASLPNRSTPLRVATRLLIGACRKRSRPVEARWFTSCLADTGE
jgi:hypothetical protein